MADLTDPCNGEPLAMTFILVVEDDVDILTMLEYSFKLLSDFYVIPARSGSQALHLVQSIKPDFFLLDYQLPDMDGIELHAHLRSQRDYVNVPTLFMSAHPSPDLFEELHLSYLQKPFALRDLFRKIQEML